MITKRNTIIKITSNDVKGHVSFNVLSKDKILSYSLNIFFEDKSIVSFENKVNDFVCDINYKINKPKLWSVNHPNLYIYQLTLYFDNDKEIINDYFGIRKISTNKKYICINDIPIFIKGYIRGATAHEHLNNTLLSEEEFYRKNIKTAKSFGFNLVRFHSQIPNDTFFKVADEEGLLVHIEMRPPHDLYNNLEEMVKSKDDFINEDFIKDTINKLFNHPSLLVYCLGNEIRNLQDNNIVLEIGKNIKSLDPTRLYLDTCAWGENSRPIVDIDVQHMSYYFPFGKHKGMYDDINNLRLGDFNKDKEIKFNVPLLAHEVCHYTALRDFKGLKGKFISNKKDIPWWIDEEIKMIHEKGYDDIYPLMYKASKSWQLNCWKIAFEAMRNSSLLGGFHFLQFADTDKYENSNGVVDCFDDVNFITPKDFLKFNGDIIITALLDKYHYYCSSDINLPLYISRFDELDLKECDINFEIKGLKNRIFGAIYEVDVSKHDHYKVGNIQIHLPEVDILKECVLNISLMSGKKIICSNSYKIWIYPKLKSLAYKEFVNYEKENVVVTDNIDKCFNSLKEGKNVCLIYRSDFTRHVLHKDMAHPQYAFKASWNRFKPVIWDRGTNFGGLIDVSKLSYFGFNNYFVDNIFCVISEDSDKIILDDVPFKVTNLISGIDKSSRDRFDAYRGCFNLPELMHDRTLRNYSYMFEVGVEKGKLLVTGMNLSGLDSNEESSNYFASFIINYLSSKSFNPAYITSLDQLESYMVKCAASPIKERMMTQFWALDDTPVESKQYWIDSKKYLLDN